MYWGLPKIGEDHTCVTKSSNSLEAAQKLKNQKGGLRIYDCKPILTRICEWSDTPGARKLVSASVNTESKEGLTRALSSFLEMKLLPEPLLQVKCLPVLLRLSRSDSLQHSLNSSI